MRDFMNYMITALFLIVLLTHISDVEAQQSVPAVLLVKKYNKGIYRNVDEFLENYPSIKKDFKLVKRKPDERNWLGGGEYSLFVKDTVLTRDQLRDVWGVSTGDTIYINTSNYGYGPGFEKISGLGRYCYWQGRANKAMYSGMIPGDKSNNGSALGVVDITYDAGYILNPNNGKIFSLTRNIMRKILADDSQLLSQYNRERKENESEILLQYIRLYNEKHSDEIGVRTYDVVCYRRQKSERQEPLKIVMNDSISFKILPGEIFEKVVSQATIKVCIGNICTEWTLLDHTLNYIECSFMEEDSEPVSKLVKRNVGEYYTMNNNSRVRQTREE
ncbi:MAG TPA: DUF6563 family protein [Ohtaekwangia sp.]|uniref:DUF6563 family protein n=1 Tax=Ohtaekwangia sp. TaxID=2066019 RepID=UPI002F93040D